MLGGGGGLQLCREMCSFGSWHICGSAVGICSSLDYNISLKFSNYFHSFLIFSMNGSYLEFPYSCNGICLKVTVSMLKNL